MFAIIFSLFSFDSARSSNSTCATGRSPRPAASTLDPATLQPKAPAAFGHLYRPLWVWLSRLWSGWRSALIIVKPETVISWHRQGFRLYWRWKSRHMQGRPVSHEVIDLIVIDLIRKMSMANPYWGAPRIHGELLMLGFELSETTVAKYISAKGLIMLS
jgi:hypothetical protein